MLFGAGYTKAATTEFGLIALNPIERGLWIDGGGDIIVNNGAIQVNSEASDAVRLTGRPTLVATELDITGNYYGWIPPELIVNTGVSPVLDPLLDVPEPFFGPPQTPDRVVIAPGETRILQPGYYPGGIEILDSSATAILEPGIYVLDGIGLNIFSGNLIADTPGGVMFYITGTGRVDLRGNVRINEFEDGPWGGMAIFQDRDNHNDARIIGTNFLDIKGTIYFPQNYVEIGGEGDLGSQLIADTILIHSNELLQINYDGRNPIPEPTTLLLLGLDVPILSGLRRAHRGQSNGQD